MDAIPVVIAYLDAHNAHDIDRVLAALTDDFRFEAVGVWTRSGTRLARQLEEWDAVINSSLVAAELTQHDDRVTCTMTEGNDWFRLAGIDVVDYQSCTFKLRAGQIASITAIMAAESARTIGQTLQAITAWASQHRRPVLSELMPGGEFLYTKESAVTWLKLLEEWRANT